MALPLSYARVRQERRFANEKVDFRPRPALRGHDRRRSAASLDQPFVDPVAFWLAKWRASGTTLTICLHIPIIRDRYHASGIEITCVPSRGQRLVLAGCGILVENLPDRSVLRTRS